MNRNKALITTIVIVMVLVLTSGAEMQFEETMNIIQPSTINELRSGYWIRSRILPIKIEVRPWSTIRNVTMFFHELPGGEEQFIELRFEKEDYQFFGSLDSSELGAEIEFYFVGYDERQREIARSDTYRIQFIADPIMTDFSLLESTKIRSGAFWKIGLGLIAGAGVYFAADSMIDDNEAPDVSLTADRTAINTGETVTLRAEADDPDGSDGKIEFKWRSDPGGTFFDESGNAIPDAGEYFRGRNVVKWSDTDLGFFADSMDRKISRRSNLGDVVSQDKSSTLKNASDLNRARIQSSIAPVKNASLRENSISPYKRSMMNSSEQVYEIKVSVKDEDGEKASAGITISVQYEESTQTPTFTPTPQQSETYTPTPTPEDDYSPTPTATPTGTFIPPSVTPTPSPTPTPTSSLCWIYSEALFTQNDFQKRDLLGIVRLMFTSQSGKEVYDYQFKSEEPSRYYYWIRRSVNVGYYRINAWLDFNGNGEREENEAQVLHNNGNPVNLGPNEQQNPYRIILSFPNGSVPD